MAFRIYFWSFFFISGYGQLQIRAETFLGISLLSLFFAMAVVFFVFIHKEKYHKLMYAICTILGIFIAVLIAMNFVWPMLFGLPVIK